MIRCWYSREPGLAGLALHHISRPHPGSGEVLVRVEAAAVQRGVNAMLGEICVVPQPVQFSGSERISPMRTPILGEDTDDVLRSELELSESEIAALRAAKVI
jgi:crotonobetainyl-CoA:carnitine CoA-transferase CaiB-like acyl-CoA transferase